MARINIVQKASSDYLTQKPVQETKQTVGGTIKNIGAVIGTGLANFGERAFDAALQFGTSKYNPYYLFNKDKLASNQKTAERLIKDDSSQEALNKIGLTPEKQQELDRASALKSTGLGGRLVTAGAEMIPSLLLGNAASGSTAVKTIASTLPLAANAYGGGIEEAYQAGANRKEANKYGVLNTAVELATEYITGGVPGVKTGFLSGIDKLAEKGIDKVGSKLAKELLKAGYRFAGEGFEEGLAEVLNPLIKNASYTSGEKVNWENVINSTVEGAILGGILNLPSDVINIKNAAKERIIPVKAATEITTPQQTNVQESTIAPTTQQTTQQGAVNIQEQAKKRFGITDDFEKAGFILDDGKMLNFRKKDNYINEEHEEIENIQNMETFINNGGIRIGDKGTTGVLEIGKSPTNEQLYKIMDFADSIKKQGKPITIELKVGNKLLGIKYDVVNSLKIKNDIRNFYTNKTIPLNVEVLKNDFENQKENPMYEKQQQALNNWKKDGLEDFIPKLIKQNPQLFPNKEVISQPIITPTTQEAITSREAIQQPVEQPSMNTNDRIETIKNTISPQIIEGAKANKTSYGSDIYRNVENVFGKNADVIKKTVLEPFDKSKLNYVDFLKNKASELKTNVDTWGIQKGSKDSALIQKYGEKLISLDELKKQTSNWENVVKADKYFREQYDQIIDKINASRQQIYPNVEKNIEQTKTDIEKIDRDLALKKQLLKITSTNSAQYDNIQNQIANLEFRKETKQNTLKNEDLFRGKRIPKRADYYRHFQEMVGGANGLVSLANIITSPNDISSKLAGVSEYTKPSSKFSSIFQKRTGAKTTYDAVGGFLNYLPSASYAINIDPNIKVFRELGKTLAEQTTDKPTMNKFIEYINDYANDLAGKTNPADRWLQKVITRKGMQIMNNVSGRIKSNAVLGNISSSLSQVLNLPNGIADVGNPKYLTKGFKDTIAKSLAKGDNYSESQFISERYLDINNDFDTKLINQPKKFAKWMLTALDEVSTKFIWNSEYAKAIDKGIENPINYADNQTRKMVAGRGIGEMTLTQKSKVISTLAPFTVEVGNSMRVMKDFIKGGRVDKLLILFIMNFLFNKSIEKIGGGGRVIDPIQTIADVINEQDTSLLQKFGRVAGEVIGNIPFGQQIASLYPEYGMTIGNTTTPTRKELFGENDPTRFGTGNMFAKAAENPVTSLLTPFGGSQINKTVKGIKGLTAEVPGGYSKSGLLQYPIEPTASNIAKGILFGTFNETQDYYNKNRSPLSENQLASLKESANIKEDYEAIMKIREYNKLIKKVEELEKQGKDTSNIIRQIEELFK